MSDRVLSRLRPTVTGAVASSSGWTPRGLVLLSASEWRRLRRGYLPSLVPEPRDSPLSFSPQSRPGPLRAYLFLGEVWGSQWESYCNFQRTIAHYYSASMVD